jgi:anti-sigma factor RsiW
MGAVHCQEVAERTTDYLEHALTAAERRRYERHLEGCDACREALRRMRTLLELARRVPPPAPSSQLRGRLLATFRDRQGRGA